MRHSSTATIVACYGNRGVLQPEGPDEADLLPYVLKGRRLRPVCGDVVDWQASDNPGEAVVTAVHARRNTLERPDSRGKREALAANLDSLAIVVAPEPAPDYFIIDRFICAAELAGAAALLIWNKADLVPALPAEMSAYRELGYPVISASATTGTGMDELEAHLGQGLSMLVGQSGVGKSSLINRLVDAADALTGALSDTSREGRHTTTASFAHPLRTGGMLVDSPGVRDFAPAIDDAARVQNGFREIVRLADGCRFADCTHTREPKCAVKEAVESGAIATRRYDSYKRLRNISAQFIAQNKP